MNKNFFNAENAVMLFIDHQEGTVKWVHSLDENSIRTNVLVLAKIAKTLGMPVIITSNFEEKIQGCVFKELEEIVPDAYRSRVKRYGIVDAMCDTNFAGIIKNTKRKNLIVAGIPNDVCTVFPVLSALNDGYNVQVVADAGGSSSAMNDRAALKRMCKMGAVITTTSQIAAELAQNWTSEKGEDILKILMDDIYLKNKN